MKSLQKTKKIIATFLALAIIMSLLPMQAFAVEHDDSCGYIASAAEQPCTHTHDNNCGDTEGTEDAGAQPEGEPNGDAAVTAQSVLGSSYLLAAPQVASAAVEVGDFIVTGGIQDTDYSYNSGTLTIKTSTAITIANTNPTTPTTDKIAVGNYSTSNYNITLAGVNIDVSTTEDAAFDITNIRRNSNVNLTLAPDSTNYLSSGANKAGLNVSGLNEAIITIDGEGALHATGGARGAGIGGGLYSPVFTININNGIIVATGGTGSAGIGSGNDDNYLQFHVNINGGHITATGGGPSSEYKRGGAGVGGSGGGRNAAINIGGTATVIATGGKNAAGIGAGEMGTISTFGITINGSANVTATGTSQGAGIGGALHSAAIANGGIITISDTATVMATGGVAENSNDSGAGIGGGGGSDKNSSLITISDTAKVTAVSHAITHPAIDTIGDTISSKVVMANYATRVSAHTATTIKGVNAKDYDPAISYAPSIDYQSIAFTVPYTINYTLFKGETQQAHRCDLNSDQSKAFAVFCEGLWPFNNVQELYPTQIVDNETITGYSTLQAAVDAVTDGQTIEILSDITLTEAVSTQENDINFTINLNGRSITHDIESGTAIYHAGTGELSITDTDGGRIISSAVSGSAVTNGSTGTLNIEGGTIRSTATDANTFSYAVANLKSGTLNIKGGTVEATGVRGVAIANANKGSVNVSSGTVQAKHESGMAIGNRSTGKITITGSTTRVTSQNSTGCLGTITQIGDTLPPATVLEITGGTVENTSTSAASYAVYFDNTTGVTGRTLSEYYTHTGGTVGKVYPQAPVAEIISEGGTADYTSLQEAFTAVADGQTITILSDITLTESAVTTNDAHSYTMDLNSHTIDGVNSCITLIDHKGTGTLTITDNATESDGEITVSMKDGGMGIAIQNSSTGTITVSGGSVSGTYDESIAIKNIDDGTIIVSNGTVSASEKDSIAVQNRGTGAITISGGTVSATCSASAIQNSNTGTITVSGGTVSATGKGTAIRNAEGATVTVSNIGEVTGENGAIDNDGTVIISGGTVMGTHPQSAAIVHNSTGKLTISGDAKVTSCGNMIEDGIPIGTITIRRVPSAGDKVILTVSDTASVTNTATPTEGYAVSFVADGVTVANVGDYYDIAETANVGRIYPEPTYTISGMITGSDTSDGIAATVYLSDKNHNSVSDVTANAEGLYEITGVPNGNYMIEVKADGYADGTITDVAVNDGNVNGKNLTLKKKYSITTTGGDAPDFATAGDTVMVTANNLHDKYFTNWTSTTEGVTFAKTTQTQTTFTMPGEDVTIIANFKDRETGTISGKVTSGGNPVSGATVKVVKQTVGNPAPIAEYTTDAEGNYSIPDVPYGVYSLVVTLGNRTNTNIITIDNPSTTKNVTLLSGNRDTMVEVATGGTPPTIAVDNLGEMFKVGDGQTNTVVIKLKVTDITNSLPADTTTVEGALLDGETVGIYLDAKLLKTVDGGTEQIIQPPEDKPLKVVIDVPPSLQNKAGYSIVRVHTDEHGVTSARTLAAIYNSTYHTLSFEADKFSTYAIAYATETAPSGGGSSGGGSSYKYYDIEIIEGENGNISPDGGSENKLSVRSWNDKTFTITPDKDYIISDVLVDGKSVGAVETYTFKEVRDDHKIEAMFKSGPKINPNTGRGNPFTDVSEDDWFFDEVLIALDKGIMTGTSDTTFEPYLGTSRAMITTMLYRLEGTPKANVKNPFNDVSENQWYTEAISWGAENGIVKGYGNGIFKPEQTITREELCAILYRYAEHKGISINSSTDLNTFVDASDISDWVKEAVSFVVAEGLMNGKGNNIFDPKGTAIRAEVAVVMLNLSGVE